MKGHGGWDEAFLETAGLEDLKGCAKLGNNILVPGDPVPGDKYISFKAEQL